MAHILVTHRDFDTLAGAESVCVNILDALQAEHELTLLTLMPPDIDAANEQFQTDVSESISIQHPQHIRNLANISTRVLNTLFGRTGAYPRLHAALLNWQIGRAHV